MPLCLKIENDARWVNEFVFCIVLIILVMEKSKMSEGSLIEAHDKRATTSKTVPVKVKE